MFGQVVHKFQRNQNHLLSKFLRAGNRSNPFENTLTILEDPAHHRKLYLIGSTHASTMLAYRTQKLINEVKPDSVYVQTNEEWWNLIKNIDGITSQSELNVYNDVLRGAYQWELESGVRNFRNTVFWARLYSWLGLMQFLKAFNSDFHPFIPGLEMKYAIEQAQAQGANVIFGGLAISNADLLSLKTEPRFDPLSVSLNFIKLLSQVRWRRERQDLAFQLAVLGGEQFAESIDKYRASWFVKLFEKLSPHQKKILVDRKDIEIFETLYKHTPGKNIVAVVNQWHTMGIEAHWRHTTKTQINTEPINPIGDMDLEALNEDLVVNDYLRQFTSRVTKSEPASTRAYITQYYKDVFEYERFRHVEFEGHSDPHQFHGGSPFEGGYQHHHPQLPADVRKQIEENWKKQYAHHHEHH
ncbi:unnamed protein product [Paramecium sonneborni]|uniref:Uncharacterized protein n=1 Tax=Paramecium sonneborni TaxID=65129 RepID=A0A8S1R9I4_9CILI|nr:unnamed protein product [Paramecium sonneborni]